jgi:outer membrane protein
MIIKKNITKIVFFVFLAFSFTQSKAETKVAFIDIDTLMNQSSAGKSLSEQLNNINQINQKNFKTIKEKLDIEKNDLSKKKNILSTDEYKKQVIDLNKKFKSLQADAKKKNESLQLKRNDSINFFLSELNKLLSEYSNKNQLTFIIDQKNIIIGKTELNITNEILKSLNKKIPKITIN